MDKLNITGTILDKLGFSKYWDENGDSGGRTLTFSNGEGFRIMEVNEKDDDTDGYAPNGRYIANHFYFCGWFALPQNHAKHYYDLFFLHEMHDCIKNEYPECLDEFLTKCKDLKMKVYIDEYLTERRAE